MARYPRLPVGGPIIIPNTALVQLRWDQDGQLMHNNLHCTITAAGPLNPTVAESIFSGIKAQTATGPWMSHIDPLCALVGVSVKDLRQGNNPMLLSSSAQLAGTGTAAPLSSGSAYVVTLRTAQSGRGFVGRVYLPGLTADLTASARMFTNPASGSLAMAFVAGVQTVIGPLLGPLVVAQRALNATTVPGAPPPYNSPRAAIGVPVTAIAVASYRIDSQRKRLGSN